MFSELLQLIKVGKPTIILLTDTELKWLVKIYLKHL